MSSSRISQLKFHFADCSLCGTAIYAGEEYIDISLNKCRVVKVENQQHGFEFETDIIYAETLLAICRKCENKVDYKNINLKPAD